MKFVEKRDYISIAVFVITALAFIYNSKLIFDSLLFTAIAGGVGAIVGYLIANFIYNKSILYKSTTLLCIIAFSYFSFYIINSNNADARAQTLSGSYITDSSDGVTVKMRVVADSIFLSMSPDYSETGYGYIMRNDSLYLYKESELKFEWDVVKLNGQHFSISDDSGEILVFKKQHL